jgi:glycine cleavage system aminomethyltransferase T
VGDIWDQLVAAGVMPCSFTALDKVRIEAGLLFYGYDMTTNHTPWEVGLGFTVSKSKGDFRGKDALMTLKGKEKVINVCLDVDLDDIAPAEQSFSSTERPLAPSTAPVIRIDSASPLRWPMSIRLRRRSARYCSFRPKV